MTVGEPNLLIEVAGLAGAGKSTLVRLLCRGEDAVRARRLEVRRVDDARLLVAGTLGLLPLAARHPGLAMRMGRRPATKAIHVERWHEQLLREQRRGLTLLDHGPMFMLAALQGFSRGFREGEPFRPWWESRARLWAQRLDAIVLLDAADDVLRRRIDARATSHPIKNAPAESSAAFLAEYRAAFETVLQHAARVPLPPTVIRIDTSSGPPEAVVECVRAALGDAPRVHDRVSR